MSSPRDVLASNEAHKAYSSDSSSESKGYSEVAKNQSYECLLSSAKNTDKGLVLNTAEAIEKLELLKETVNDTQSKNNTDSLISQLKDNTTNIYRDSNAFRQLIENACSQQPGNYSSSEVKGVEAIISQNMDKNPGINPFAAKTLKKIAPNDNKVHAPKKKKKIEDAQEHTKKKKSLLSWLFELFE
jgi:hypothetical protein